MHKLLDFTGVEYERLFVDWVSASEGKKFADVVTTFTQKIRKLGCLEIEKDGIQMQSEIQRVTS
jgi:F420-non-reducing hydrogenase iron-sulfur subunit